MRLNFVLRHWSGHEFDECQYASVPSFVFFRESLSAQLDLTVTKAESEQLARALQEEQYFELSQENKKAASRYKQEVSDKDSIITRVCGT